jgi:malic enzyme
VGVGEAGEDAVFSFGKVSTSSTADNNTQRYLSVSYLPGIMRACTYYVVDRYRLAFQDCVLATDPKQERYNYSADRLTRARFTVFQHVVCMVNATLHIQE